MLVGGLGGRGAVAGASYEARVFGARSAMPMHQARRKVGVAAVVLPPRCGVRRGQSAGLRRGTPPDARSSSSCLSMRHSGNPLNWPGLRPARSRRSARNCDDGCVRRLAWSPRWVRDRASRSPRSPPDWPSPTNPGRRRAEQQLLLDGLPVRRLWGIGPVAGEKLHRLGIETIGQLAALSDAEVANISVPLSVRRCTGSPVASTTVPSRNAPKPSRSAPNPRSPPT